MKSSLKLSLAVLTLGLSAAALVRADDQPPAPPPMPAAQPTTPPAGDDAPPPPKHGGRMDPHHLLKMYAKQLDLTADQTEKVGMILKTELGQMKALRDDDSLSEDDMHHKMRELRKSAHDQIRALLTPAQQAKFDAMPTRGEGHRPPPSDSGAPSSE